MKIRILLGVQLVFLLLVINNFEGVAQSESRPIAVEILPSFEPAASEKYRTEFKIEEKIVSSEVYHHFIGELKEIEGTYHCAKMVGGGRNSYEAVDADGLVWVVHSVVTENESRSWVSKR